MEDQGKKNHSSGVETQHRQQVHHCHKCGWPFPKPHPSAKRRRDHKRICGTVEGYKLQDTSHTIVSDEDHSDDGDYKSPQISFKKLERSPSEDDVFSDAVSNFTDASLSSGVGGSSQFASESAYAVEKVSEVVVPEFSATAEGTAAGNSTSSVTVQVPTNASSIADKSEKRSDSGGLSTTMVAETQSNFVKGAPKDHESDAESLASLLTEKNPIENNATAELMQKNEEVKVIEEINATPDAEESMLQATHEVSAIAGPDEGFTQSVKMSDEKLFSETPQNDIFPEHFAVHEPEGADSGDGAEHNYKEDEAVRLFHVPHDVLAIEHPEKIIEGSKDHREKEDVQPDNFELEVEHSQSVCENNGNKEEELRKFNVFSVPQDVPVLVNQDKIIEGFKDYKKIGWVGHDNRDLPNAVERKGEISCLSSDVLLEKDGLISSPIDQEVHVHESQQFNESDNLRDALAHGKDKGTPEEEASLEEVTISTSRLDGEIDSNIHDKSAKEVTSYASEVNPESVAVIEVNPHTAGECFLSEEGVIEEEDVSDVKRLPGIAQVPSLLDNAAPRTTDLDGKDDSIDNNSAVEIVSTDIEGDGTYKNVEESCAKIPAFHSSEAPFVVKDGDVDQSCVEIHPIPGFVTVTGAEAVTKGSAEEEEGSNIVDSKTLSLDMKGGSPISEVETSEIDRSKEDVEEETFSNSSSSVTQKLSHDVENGIKSVESSVGLYSAVADSAASEIGIVHVAEDGVRKVAAVEESSMQSSVLHESAAKSDTVHASLDGKEGEGHSVVREVLEVESRQKSAEEFEDAIETPTDDGVEAGTATVVVGEVLNEKEELKKGDEVEGSMNELGHGVEKEAAVLLVGVDDTVTQVPNSSTVVEGGYDKDEASLQVADGTKQQQQFTASVLDASSSRSESLDANWGSVSVLSTQSDTITPTDDPREMLEVGKLNTKQQQASVETAVRHPDKLETSFEAPSFMTLVESSSVSQGVFPSLTTQAPASSASDYSAGRKKNEEIIAKVTNWTTKQPTQQQHSPLKNLLVEANRETKPISPIQKDNIDLAPPTKEEEEKKKEAAVKDNGEAAASPLISEAKAPVISQEWNSPARYPSEIKREKKKAKGKPYWAQFVCCSSGN